MRWLHFVSVFIVFGGALFWVYIRGEIGAGLPQTLARTTRLLRVAAPLALASGIAWLATTIANVTGGVSNVVDPEMLHVFFFETPFGLPSITRLALLTLLAGTALSPLAPSWQIGASAGIGAALLVSQAWLGHAVEGGATLVGASMMMAYAVHVLAAAAWAGGLPPLAVAIGEMRARGDDTLPLLSRFSAMATIAVGLIVASGAANTAFRVGDAFPSLASTPYGQVLFVKLGLVATMLALAAFNRFVVMRRLGRSASPARGALRGLGRSLAVEGLLGLCVLGAAAVLGITPPPG